VVPVAIEMPASMRRRRRSDAEPWLALMSGSAAAPLSPDKNLPTQTVTSQFKLRTFDLAFPTAVDYSHPNSIITAATKLS